MTYITGLAVIAIVAAPIWLALAAQHIAERQRRRAEREASLAALRAQAVRANVVV